MSDLFYRPENAWLADVIPFHHDGAFRLFYLLDWRDREHHGEGTPWYQISTTDFVHYQEHGEMLARGSEAEQDLYVFTGSVVEKQPEHALPERFHIFYTGHNPHFHAQGKPVQAVMHAVSDDLLHWRKVPEDTFFAPPSAYEPDDWRDPFVFWNPEAGEYWMLLAARLKNHANQDANLTYSSASRRRGCTALCASKDLKTWEVRPPFWTPGLYFTHECPDLFRMGEWWYQVFSEFSDRSVTRYRMSRSLNGPWAAPENDTFDGRAFYAAKTATDGTRRYAFGWNPTQEANKDYKAFQWGGSLVVHEIVQEADGTLSVRPPQSVIGAFGSPVTPVFTLPYGESSAVSDALGVTLDCPGSIGSATAGTLPPIGMIEATLTFAPGTRGCGLMLRMSDDLDEGYYVRLEPGRNRLVFDAWPRAGDVPYMIGLERPLFLAPDTPVTLRVFVEGTVCEVYINDQIAMSCRMYNRSEGVWGVFAQEGRARFTEMRLSERSMD